MTLGSCGPVCSCVYLQPLPYSAFLRCSKHLGGGLCHKPSPCTALAQRDDETLGGWAHISAQQGTTSSLLQAWALSCSGAKDKL